MSTINNTTYARFIKGTDYADSISNNNKKVTISAGTGDDYVWNEGGAASINGGTGNDKINNYGGRNVIINGGDDTIVNWSITFAYNVTTATGRHTYIDGGNGNDSITSWGTNYVTLSGGNGDDTIENYSSVSKVYGGAGNDLINGNAGAHVTIEAGAGNDIISLGSDATNTQINYTSGDGNDSIVGFNETSTLRIGDGKGTYSTVASGEDIIATVGRGKITLVGAVDLDEIHIDGAQVLTVTDEDSASLTAPADFKFVNAASRTTALQITGNKFANSILGGAANDTIWGGYGADTIMSNAGNDTLWGGTGADIFIYNPGEGKDVIRGFDNTDMLQITGDWTATYYGGSGRVVFKVDSTYSAIILENSTAATYNINGETYHISGNTLAK